MCAVLVKGALKKGRRCTDVNGECFGGFFLENSVLFIYETSSFIMVFEKGAGMMMLTRMGKSCPTLVTHIVHC